MYIRKNKFSKEIKMSFVFEPLDDGTVEITRYNGEEGHVVIPSIEDGKEDGKRVTVIGGCAFMEKHLTSVTIPEGITKIEAGAFAENDLTSIVLPNSVIRIEADAFNNNPITSITIAEGVDLDAGAFEENYFEEYSRLSEMAGTYVYISNEWQRSY